VQDWSKLAAEMPGQPASVPPPELLDEPLPELLDPPELPELLEPLEEAVAPPSGFGHCKPADCQ
jgi:hypothetical protein